MKNGKFLVIVYVLTFIFVLIGSTFAYFTQTAKSNEGAIATKSATVGISLDISPLYVEKELIPMEDSDVIKAYKDFHCVDINEFGACQAYTIKVENVGEADDYEGTVSFSLTKIKNLNYLIFDGSILDAEDLDTLEENEIRDRYVYKDKTNIVAETDQSLGASFNLPKDGSKTFVMVIWVPNFDRDQFEDDGSGNFSALVTYKSTGNYQITGSISGN